MTKQHGSAKGHTNVPVVKARTNMITWFEHSVMPWQPSKKQGGKRKKVRHK